MWGSKIEDLPVKDLKHLPLNDKVRNAKFHASKTDRDAYLEILDHNETSDPFVQALDICVSMAPTEKKLTMMKAEVRWLRDMYENMQNDPEKLADRKEKIIEKAKSLSPKPNS